MRRLGIDKWLVCPVQFMFKDMRSRVKVGDGFSEELDVVVDVHQGSVLSRLLLIIVLEAPSREFHTGCLWEQEWIQDFWIGCSNLERGVRFLSFVSLFLKFPMKMK